MGAFFADATTPYRLGIAGMVAGRSDIAWRDRGFLELTGGDGGSRKKSVALISGGGSCHEPLHAGFLGAGMLHAVCPGHIFTSPNARQILEATRAVDDGSGVVHIVKNYTGDVMNFGVAAKLAAEEGIRVETVLVGDDVATDLGDRDGGDGADGEDGGSDGPGRRGTGATILVEKACGAAAARGADVGVVADVGRNVARRARSIAMSLSGAHTPGSEESFSLEEDEAEFGVGIHGERGVDRRTREDIADTVGEMIAEIHAPTTAPAWDAPAPYAGVPDIADGTIDELPAADSGPKQPELSAWIERVLGAHDELTALDRKAGDGDFGVNMRAALGPFDLPLRGTVGDVLHSLGESYLVRAGGTSGAVFGLFFATMGAAAGDAKSIPDADVAAAARVAGKGRASYVGDAAKGVADPGALVMGWFFEELAR